MNNTTLTDILRAKRELVSARKAADREYRDRIRKLTKAEDNMVSAAYNADAELVSTDATLDPELLALIHNPLKGL